jgi:hypothetical protein
LWDWRDGNSVHVVQWPSDLCTRFYKIGIRRGSFCTSLCTLGISTLYFSATLESLPMLSHLLPLSAMLSSVYYHLLTPCRLLVLSQQHQPIKLSAIYHADSSIPDPQQQTSQTSANAAVIFWGSRPLASWQWLINNLKQNQTSSSYIDIKLAETGR